MLYFLRMSQGKIVLAVIGVVVVLFIAFGIWNRAQPGAYDAFAQCLADEGATFYGAFWCPHCQEQKELLGNSAKLLPYQECSTPDGRGQIALCNEAGIESYPTWHFADGSVQPGVVPLATLAEKTKCALPQ